MRHHLTGRIPGRCRAAGFHTKPLLLQPASDVSRDLGVKLVNLKPVGPEFTPLLLADTATSRWTTYTSLEVRSPESGPGAFTSNSPIWHQLARSESSRWCGTS